jgi:trk system potassium uptake protein TrkH
LSSVGRFLDRTLHPTQVIVLSFAGVILLGAGLLTTGLASAAAPVSFVDALFTSTSAVCVTGLAVVDTGTRFSTFGQVVILLLIQLGGLGIMTYSSVFLLVAGGRLSFRGQVVVEETLGRKARSPLDRLIREVFLYTLAIEAVGAAFLTLAFGPRLGWWEGLYSGVFHSVSAFCNAGFSLFSANLMEYRGSWLVNLVIMALIILGGLGFTVMGDVLDGLAARRAGRAVRLQLHTKVVLATTAALLAVGTVGLYLFESNNALLGLPWHEQLLACLFQSVTPRTAGFNTLDYGSLTASTLFFTILLMFIGASPGSTGGGIKTTTLAVMLAVFRSRILARSRASLFRRSLPEDTVSRSVAILTVSFVLVTLVIFLLLATEVGDRPYRQGTMSFVEVMFESVSAFGTVGLSTGITPRLSAVGKLVLTVLMFVGRVGPLTLAMAVGRKAEKAHYQYADENVVVG